MSEEEDKYYTPSAEEFHVGFEYEISNALVRGCLAITPPEEWYKYKFINIKPYDLELIQYIIDNELKMIRVKYLDKDDIESFGFQFRQEYQSCIVFDNKDYFISIIDKSFSDNKHKIVVGVDNGMMKTEDILFNGTIKNKSELKVLLKQLGIE